MSRITWAQSYRMRPVQAVVAFAPGGVTDTFARLMAQKLTEQLDKQVYVENIAWTILHATNSPIAFSAMALANCGDVVEPIEASCCGV